MCVCPEVTLKRLEDDSLKQFLVLFDLSRISSKHTWTKGQQKRNYKTLHPHPPGNTAQRRDNYTGGSDFSKLSIYMQHSKNICKIYRRSV